MTITRALLLAGWVLLAFVAASLISNPAEFARVVKPFLTHFVMLVGIALVAAFYATRLIRRGLRRSAAEAAQRGTRKRKYRG